MYWFFSTVVSKSSVHTVACGPIVDVTSTMDWLNFGHNGCVCLGMTYLAKLRRLTDFEKTLHDCTWLFTFTECHRSDRFNVWQCQKTENLVKKRMFVLVFTKFGSCSLLLHPIGCKYSKNHLFRPCYNCWVSKFWLCHGHRPLVSKCWTDSMCHGHRGVSNWSKWYSIFVWYNYSYRLSNTHG